VSTKHLIVIVDDDESVRSALRSLLKSMGLPAETFPSAEKFLASHKLHRTSCLIVDVNMPGMTGPALHRHLQASGIDIPTILITAYPDDGARDAALKDGVIGFLTKPFDEKDLLAGVHSALGTAGLSN
jgi:FixJ family two-component response regulator